MDISSLSHSRYSERSFNPVQYTQPQQLGYPGGAAGPAVVGGTWPAGPLPGSNYPVSNVTWLEQPKEMAALEMIHVSEKGFQRFSKLFGMWELQSWAVRRAQDQQNSAERQAEASRFLTRSAIASLTAFTGQLATAGQSIDIYA